MKIINKYKSLFFMSFAAFALFFISTNQAKAAVDEVGKTHIMIYDSADQELDANTTARIGALIRAGRAVYRAGAYAAGFAVGFVQGVVSGANGGPQPTENHLYQAINQQTTNLSVFDQ